MVSSYFFQDIRLYVTRDSRTGKLAIWALNFSNDQDAAVELHLQNLPRVNKATLMRLQAITGKTTLFSANLSSEMGGPAINVDWTSSDFTSQNLGDLDLSLPAATLSLLVIEPGLDRLTPGFVEQDGQKRFSVTFRRLAHASDARYRLLRSQDLTSWETVTEVEAGLTESISLTDNLATTSSTPRFYRVELVGQ